MPKKSARPTTVEKAEAATDGKKPKLLSGGNPQIPKGYGDAPVQAYIAAMPEWKREIGRRIDNIVTQTVPGVQKAVKWNSPFYGNERDSWFLSFHMFTRYVKVSFFRGTSLDPMPPGASKHPNVRYLDIHEANRSKTNSGSGSYRRAVCRARRCKHLSFIHSSG